VGVKTSTPPVSEKPWHRPARGAALALGLGVALWILFTFVITDRALFLDYVRVLAWPALAALALVWLREPLRDKLRQLLRIEVPGGAAQFADSGDELARSLKPDVDTLLGDDAVGAQREDGHSLEVVSDPASGTDDAIDLHPQADASGSQDEEASASVVAPAATLPANEISPRAETSQVPAAVDTRLLISRFRLVQLAKTVGLGPKEARRLIVTMERDPDAALMMIEAGAKNTAVHRSQQSRDSIESIIRKSAAWGYDMGIAGAPGAEPEIEWNPDGSWRITTEVPPGRRSGEVLRAAQLQASRARHIRELEDEIKKIERERSSPLGMGGGMELGLWLSTLKSKLNTIDPGSPWTL
jgi:hypothetical protein